MLALLTLAAISAPFPVGGCSGTRYGCCPDGLTARHCPAEQPLTIGGCGGTHYGCCPDGVSPASCPATLGVSTSNCTECVKVVTILENVGPAALNATGHLFQAIADICKAIPGPSAHLCKAIADDAGKIVLDIEHGMNATSVCRALGFCPESVLDGGRGELRQARD